MFHIDCHGLAAESQNKKVKTALAAKVNELKRIQRHLAKGNFGELLPDVLAKEPRTVKLLENAFRNINQDRNVFSTELMAFSKGYVVMASRATLTLRL